jgi:hypothetical protein
VFSHAQRIIRFADKCGSGLVPFAADCDDNLLVIDTRDGGAVKEWDEDGVGDTKSGNFCAYLEEFNKNLLSGGYSFIPDVGIVQVGFDARKMPIVAFLMVADCYRRRPRPTESNCSAA